MKRIFLDFLAGLSIIGLIITCWLWSRSTTGVDSASLTYDRYLSDGRAASNAIYFTSDHRLWLNIHSGSVEAFNGQLVWGYHVSADMSKGKPIFRFNRSPYVKNIFLGDGRATTDDRAMSGWGPVRWDHFRRVGNGEKFRSITFGVSHWLLLILLLLIPLLRLNRWFRSNWVMRREFSNSSKFLCKHGSNFHFQERLPS